MIKTYKNMWVAHFGYGEICIHRENDESGTAFLDLSTCKQSTIGSKPDPKIVKDFPKIRLRFDKTESVDVLIGKLQNLKQMMMEDANVYTSRSTEKKSRRIRSKENRNLPTSETP